ncbi:hypothetical protein GQX74_007005 [Glossina fuscipes]|nr:hypothetical protein GQX74_007005 [Glossina fuscipes]
MQWRRAVHVYAKKPVSMTCPFAAAAAAAAAWHSLEILTKRSYSSSEAISLSLFETIAVFKG